MLFNSAQFLFGFLPVALSVFLLLGSYGHRMLAIGWLAMASLVFYGWDDPLRLLPIILSSTAFNFVIGRMLVRKPNRGVLAFGIFGNLLLLGYFKYVGFLAEILTTGTSIVVPNPNVVLPLGISFFTFTQIAYLVDAYRGKAREYDAAALRAVRHLLPAPDRRADPAPQGDDAAVRAARDATALDTANLIAVRPDDLRASACSRRCCSPTASRRYVAPVFAPRRRRARSASPRPGSARSAYTFQLYFDFSGYSDMAIGLVAAVRHPPAAQLQLALQGDVSIIDFWRRWHMTLSRFLRDYLYIPLGGNRTGPARRYVNLMVDDAARRPVARRGWTFVVWGGLHGAGLMINHLWRTVAQTRNWVIPSSLAWAITFAFVVLAWIPFRADGVHAAVSLWKGMIGVNGFLAPESVVAGQFAAALGWIGALLALALIGPNTQQLMSYSGVAVVATEKPGWRPSLRWGAVAGILFGASVLSIVAQRPTEFLYFRF